MTAAHGTGKVFDFTRGDRFRRARLSAGYDSAQDFAELIGVSRNTVSGAENDRSLPRPIVIRAWALATGADSRWLETGEAPGGGGPDQGVSPTGGKHLSPVRALRLAS